MSENHRIGELRLWNFRAYQWAYLPLSDLTVLVGPNGSGKSTIAQAINIISQGLREGLETALAQSDGAANLVSRGLEGGSDRMGLAVVLRYHGVDWKYGFVLRFRGTGDYVLNEEGLIPSTDSDAVGFFRDSDHKVWPVQRGKYGPDPLESPISIEAPYLAFPIVGGVRTEWAEIADILKRMYSYQLVPEAIRMAHQAGSTDKPLSRDGANAADVLAHLADTKTHQWIVEHLQHTTEGVEDAIARAAFGLRSIAIQQRVDGRVEEFTGHALSDGTMRMLGALLALRQEPRPSLVFLDELDADLHPPVVGVLIGAIEASLDRTQVIVSSHSADALGEEEVTAERIRILRWSGGKSTIHPVHPGIRELMKPPQNAGRLLSMGALQPDEKLPYEHESKGHLDRQMSFLGVKS